MIDPQAARATIARRQAKRALGTLRRAAAELAAASSELDVVGDIHLDQGDELAPLLEAVRLARHRHAAIDVVIVATPAPRRHNPERSSSSA